MAHVYNVLIGIQARSTSERFPRKVFAEIGGKPLLQHVIDSCENTARYINRNTSKGRGKTLVTVALLIPQGDEIKEHFPRTRCIEGDEQDVLSRYYKAAKVCDADYIVRVTGDCPLIPSPVITKCITTVIKNNYDYVSNVFESVRASQDGTDCEAFNMRTLENANNYANSKHDREHVTTWMRNQPDIKYGHIVPFLYGLGHEKISVDTPEDLERVREMFDKLQQSIYTAEVKHGKDSLHRF